jgi:kynurenine formamidase
MKITINRTGPEFDLSNPIDLSIPLRFNGPQPNAYGVEQAASEACEYGTLVGDTRRGGSCNFERYTFIPHCNGTHTECIGHITNERISVRDCLQDAFLSANLVSVQPVHPNQTDENYTVEIGKTDLLITRSVLAEALHPNSLRQGFQLEALIVRTLPNEDGKLIQSYQGKNIPPYFTSEAMGYIVESGVEHLLVDLPSIDRLYDEGGLSNHRIFWNVEQGSFETDRKSRTRSTVTELIYVSNEIKDGEFLLNLQIAPFESDCAPSRPVLFSLS